MHDYWEEVFLVSGDLIVGMPQGATALIPRAVHQAAIMDRSNQFMGVMLLELHTFDPV